MPIIKTKYGIVLRNNVIDDWNLDENPLVSDNHWIFVNPKNLQGMTNNVRFIFIVGSTT